ncbi:MAG TPA: endolytic transglycosylase MltG [Chloroflexota bacterium]|nr:endolytic transglycosylase MltG [Chloroflexota bacterium]
MRIVVIFMMLLMVSIVGVSLLASTTLKSGTEAIVDFANTARAQSQPLVATPIPAPREEGPARPPNAPAQPAPTVAPAAPVAEGETTAFVVRQGETTGSIAERLTQTGLVAHPTIFRFWVQWKGAEGRLQAGEYRLRQGMSMDEIIDAMLTARARDVAVTFVEGRRLEEYAEILQGADVGIEGQRFLELATRGNFAYDFLESKPPGATLEGYLFPDTYRVIPGKTTAEELIHQMLKRFGENMPPQVREQAQKNTGLNVHQTVVLASIVEREAQVKGERPRIAAVYTNRLRDRECLCADATIQYGIGKGPEWWPVLRQQARTIEPQNPFNTYTNPGLPPGPIASPGASALQAAAEPEKTAYKYYVRNDVQNDGSHVFALTLAEHEQNITRYQRRS